MSRAARSIGKWALLLGAVLALSGCPPRPGRFRPRHLPGVPGPAVPVPPGVPVP
jgi:hypothetical protein